MTDQSFLLTGSSGTIGTVLAERLLDRGFDITGADVESNRWSGAVDAVTIEVDLRDRGAVNRLPDVDTIVHLAANARVMTS